MSARPYPTHARSVATQRSAAACEFFFAFVALTAPEPILSVLPLARLAHHRKEECIAAGHTWARRDNNFDHIGHAVSTLFQIALGQNWVEVMHFGVDGVGPTQGPVRDYNPAASCYIIFFVFFSSLFLINLFTSVILDGVARKSRELRGAALLTMEQREWLATQAKLRSALRLVANAQGAAGGFLRLRHLTKHRRARLLIAMCTCALGLHASRPVTPYRGSVRYERLRRGVVSHSSAVSSVARLPAGTSSARPLSRF